MAVHVTPSSINWTPIGIEYFNTDKGIIDTNETSISGGFIESDALKDIADVVINHDTLLYLTKKTLINDVFTSQYELTSNILSQVPLSGESLTMGSNTNSSFVTYYYCNSNNPQFNKTVNINTTEDDILLNYILFSPFKTQLRTYKKDKENPLSEDITSFQFNYLNLKNYMTPSYDYDQSVGTSIREYNNIYLGTSQRFGLYNMFLGYVANTEEFIFPSNDTTFFHYPLESSRTALSASTLIDRGAKAGDSPMNADIIAVDQGGYYNYTSSGNNQKNNGEFLCAWLSGTNNCGCSSVWVERWYDPDTVTQGDAYIQSKKLSGTCGNIWDVPSTMELIPGVKYYYDRYGADRNDVSLDYIDSLLSFRVSEWNTKILDSGGSEVGFISPNYKGESTTLVLDGNTYAQFSLVSESTLPKDEITVALDVYKDNWCCGKNAQLVGNYHFGGWGISYNTGIPNNILTVGDGDGNLFAFNIEGTRIFEKYTRGNPRLHNVSFDWITTDLNGARWALDSFNNKILKLDVDDILIEVLNFPPSFDVNKVQISQDNKIYFFDNSTKTLFIHNETGDYFDSISAPSSATNFEIKQDGTVMFDVGDLLSINSRGDVYRSWGSNLYKNGTVLFNFSTKILDFKIDAHDNVWIAYKGNRIVKIDVNDVMIFDTITMEFLSNDTNVYIGLVRKAINLGCDADRVWIVYGDNRFLVELDTNGVITDTENTSKLVLTKSCENYVLKARGDFTGYDVHRKFEVAGDSIISFDNPAISLKIKLEDACGNTRLEYINVAACKLANGWHNFGFTYGKSTGKLNLFIDGTIAESITIEPNKWSIKYNNVSPLIIGGNSGKLGSENEEKSIIEGQYFVGEVRDLRLYTKEIPDFLFQSIYNKLQGYYEPLKWNIEVRDKHYIECIDSFFMNKKPGYKSRKFNIKINNLDIDPDLKLLIEDAIIGSVGKLIPKYTELNSVVWS
jgi:hypothetical protein